MNSIIYIGIDVHKSSYSYCAYSKEEDCFFAEHKSEADSKNAINYIKSVIFLSIGAEGIYRPLGCTSFSSDPCI